MFGLADFAMLHQLIMNERVSFNRASLRHAHADLMQKAGLVEIEALPQNECRVQITSAGRVLASKAHRLLSIWSSQLAGHDEQSSASLRKAISDAKGALSRASEEVDELEAAMAVALSTPEPEAL